LKAGTIIVTANCPGLKSATLKIKSQPFATENGFVTVLPDLPKAQLAETHSSWANLAEAVPPITTTALTENAAQAGKFIESFAYTGPTAGAKVQTGVVNGTKIYSDRDFAFADLPQELSGADWVQVPQADALYSAVDLMQLVVQAGTEIYVAHDTRLAAPSWLTTQFRPTDLTVAVDGQQMKIFSHESRDEGSVTLGSNTDDASMKEANAYIVFVNATQTTINSSENTNSTK